MAIAFRASSGDMPASTIAMRSSRAIPVPAAPEPASTKRVPTSVRPVERSAARTAATEIAAVPWMSSLNEQTHCR